MELHVKNVPEMYSEMMSLMKMCGVESPSRNGPVLRIPCPLMVHVMNPSHRVLIDPVRRANPFFHVMEFVWMMAGRRDAEWIGQFAKNITKYAEEDGKFHGAYGYRWRRHWNLDQIKIAVDMLYRNPDDRRVVLEMWDANWDLGVSSKDLPCNTHIYLEVWDGALNMMVCNRSNDVIWGMTGANAVHMTFLMELIANALKVKLGWYTVATKNAHVYLDLPNVKKMLNTRATVHLPPKVGNNHVPLLEGDESLYHFLDECENFVDGRPVEGRWLRTVAAPMRDLYLSRGEVHGKIKDSNWEFACQQWLLSRA